MARLIIASLCGVGLAACATSSAAVSTDGASASAAADWAPWPGTSADDWRGWPGPARAAASPSLQVRRPSTRTPSRASPRDGAASLAPVPGAMGPRASAGPPASSLGLALAARAGDLVGASSLRAFTSRLPDDCTGLVRLVYEMYGLDLMAAGGVRGENGVTAMWRLASDAGALHHGTPRPGDLVFFVETYDRNRDRVLNDGLTHVGVVESVDDAGTVSFVHRSGRGVTRGRLTPAMPGLHATAEGRVLNDWLRPRSRIAPSAFTGELFAGYASADALSRSVGTAALARYSASLP